MDMKRRLKELLNDSDSDDEDPRRELLFKLELLRNQRPHDNDLYEDMRHKSTEELRHIVDRKLRKIETERCIEHKKEFIRHTMLASSMLAEKLAEDNILPLKLNKLTDDTAEILYPRRLPPIPTEEQLKKREHAQAMDEWIEDLAEGKDNELQLSPEVKIMANIFMGVMNQHRKNMK